MNRLLPLLVGALALVPVASQSPSSAAERLNVVVILADDLGYGDLGFTGNPILRTPHLDALAERSARLSRFYVNPFCGPTRAALLTGRYPHLSGVHSNGAELSPKAVTIAEVLAASGYATGIFGKWHLGPHHPKRAMDQGFQECLVSRGGLVGELAPIPEDLGRYTNPVFEHNGRLVERTGYATQVSFDACLDWIERVHEQEQPFFAYLSPNVPHRPFDDVPEAPYRSLLLRMKAMDPSPTATALEIDETARAYAMIEDLDANVGRLFARLEKLGVLENTLVIFLSDNGANGERFGAGFRGIKGNVYEGSLRSVFLAHCPARLEAGDRSDRIAAHVDLFPTLVEACGAEPPAGVDLDGRSLMPLLEGREVEWPDRTFFFEGHKGSEPQPWHNYAVLTQDWKLVRSGVDLPMERFDGDLANLAHHELFHLTQDPFESNDRIGSEGERALELRRAYQTFARSIEANVKQDQPEGRVIVGDAAEDPVLLTHAHWGRISPDDEGGERRREVVQDEAVMAIRSLDRVRYDVVVRFSRVEKPTQVFFSLRKQGKRKGSVTERTAEVPVGAAEVVIEDVELEQGRYDLLAVIGSSRTLGRPVWQVELRRRQ